MIFAGVNFQQVWESLDVTFISLFYLLLVAIALWVYYIVPGKFQWIVLLAASTVFYLICGLRAFILVLLTALVTYFFAIYIEATDRTQQKKRRIFLSIALLVILSILIYIKLYKFMNWNISLIVPVGISYYTLSLVGYLADVYWGKEQAQTNFFKLALFVLFFPKIIQGPISKHRNLAPQLTAEHLFDYHTVINGVQLIIWGYFKKLVIADRIAVLVTQLLGNYQNYGGALLALSGISYAVQLYCDFSGYMDIALGTAQMFGINMEKNFFRPFFSRSVAEFWRRWHATLGAWLRDYIYIPLDGGRCKPWKKARNAMVVWIVSGLWHGTGADFLAWGIYWGVLLSCSVLLNPSIKN